MAHATEVLALAPVLREDELGREAGLMVLYMVVTRPEIVARVLETEASATSLWLSLKMGGLRKRMMSLCLQRVRWKTLKMEIMYL
jgi:hypothetical protein